MEREDQAWLDYRSRFAEVYVRNGIPDAGKSLVVHGNGLGISYSQTIQKFV
jgi:hypothetical protein